MKTSKRTQVHKNLYPNFYGKLRQLHSCLRDEHGHIIRPIPNLNGVGAIRYELLANIDFSDIKANKIGRRALGIKKLNNTTHKILDSNWSGDIYKYCTHCTDQTLLPLEKFTSNNHGYSSCLLTKKDASKYHLKGYSSQPFCNNCKRLYVNSSGNKKRTKDQFIESSALSRFRSLLPPDLKDNKKYSNVDVFNKFGHQCFKCDKKIDINNRSSYQIDHTLPASLFWHLDKDNCTLLCYDCNQAKTDQWPNTFYCSTKLEELSRLSGYEEELLNGGFIINPKFLAFCKSNIFNKHISDCYEGRIGRRKSISKIIKRNNTMFKQLIKKIERYISSIEDKKTIFSMLGKNKHTKHLIQMEIK